MKFGAITNSWREQLADHDLTTLVREAQARGAQHVELRQTCLGDCETGQGDQWRPVLSHLRTLVAEFPDMTFDLAMAWPCLSTRSDPSGEQFQAALEGAKLVGRSLPHLRIVDPSPFDNSWEKAEDIPEEALTVADLAKEAARQGVILSMENSGQPCGAWPCWLVRPEVTSPPRKAAIWAFVPTRRISSGVIQTGTPWPSWRRCRWITSRLYISSKRETGRRTPRWTLAT